jgi:cyclase
VLQRCRTEPHLRDAPLSELVADSVDEGWIRYFAPYEDVHRANVDVVTAARGPGA